MHERHEEPPAGDAFGTALYKIAQNREVEVWPENWPVFALFCDLATQWTVAMGGPTGLRYEALYPLLDRATTSTEQWREFFRDIRLMEGAALRAMNGKPLDPSEFIG